MEDTVQIVQETKASLVEYLPKLATACQTIADRLQDVQETWIGLFEAMLEGVQWVTEALTGLQQVKAQEYDDLQVERILVVMKELLGALHNQDNVLLADLLQYELKPLLENYHANLAAK